MHPPCEVALGKFSKGPRKGGFTRYFAGKYPSAQVPQPGVDFKAFDQGPRGRHVPHCFCQKGPRLRPLPELPIDVVAATIQPKFSSWIKTELWQVVDVEPMPVFGKFYNG